MVLEILEYGFVRDVAAGRAWRESLARSARIQASKILDKGRNLFRAHG